MTFLKSARDKSGKGMSLNEGSTFCFVILMSVLCTPCGWNLITTCYLYMDNCCCLKFCCHMFLMPSSSLRLDEDDDDDYIHLVALKDSTASAHIEIQDGAATFTPNSLPSKCLYSLFLFVYYIP